MDTIVAPITPLVTSAVIMLRISGEKAFDCADNLILPGGKHLERGNIKYRHVYTGSFIDSDGSVLDEVVFYFFKSPSSYTGDDVLEISFHGNPQIVRKALSVIYEKGIRAAEPGEFTKRAFLNGKLDLTQAESVASLIESKTDKGIYYSFRQLKGSLSKKVIDIKNSLVDISSVIEAYVDFPEDDLSDHDVDFVTQKISDVLDDISKLIESYKKYRYQREGLKIVIVGKPNVGKSSLLNSLLEEERAIVSEIPGTTRDFIEEVISIKGIPVRLMDTAGLRGDGDAIESRGIEKARDKIQDADIVLVVFDLSNEIDAEDRKILGMTENKNRIVLGNKDDLAGDVSGSAKSLVELSVSAKYKTNFKLLEDMIYNRVCSDDSDLYSGEVITTERHVVLLKNLYDILISVKDKIISEHLDLISIDMGMALDIVSEFTGEKYTEEILDNIFEKFCLGK
ncbi:tRNA uridine-5-carboxymethylaminomethyl(34) synthesis GTPase MnmE [Flexistipes sp.]|uniref:tRNA uridine-5-carboxymethylaminomethyl(34) synthesis GTPase MnmE n=1 Tax=Flexistipes sp. TaxID=3088135 RepID=UPI002E1AF495|nr:tRNA uridine-5-carboxymethylaminomethyl(34) synthesis GTPase MnmE [Flexistipes sp.]